MLKSGIPSFDVQRIPLVCGSLVLIDCPLTFCRRKPGKLSGKMTTNVGLSNS